MNWSHFAAKPFLADILAPIKSELEMVMKLMRRHLEYLGRKVAERVKKTTQLNVVLPGGDDNPPNPP